MSIRIVSRSLSDLLPMRGRTPGPHVSTVISDLCVRLGMYPPSDPDSFPVTRAQLGCALEDSIADRFAADAPERYVRAGELTRDGLYVTPDIWDTGDPRIVPGSVEYDPRIFPLITREIKLTWMSAKLIAGVETPERSSAEEDAEAEGERFWRYWRQLEAQCWALGPEPWQTVIGQLTVVFAQGDYKGGDIPGVTWERSYSYGQLEGTWKMLMRHVELMRREGYDFGDREERG